MMTSSNRLTSWIKNKTVQGALIAFACAAITTLLMVDGRLEVLEFKTLDHRFRTQPVWDPLQGPPADIAIILIDQDSIDLVSKEIQHRWPWPREFYAKLIGFLHQAGAKAVVFDMFFSEPDTDRQEISGKDSDLALEMATAFASNVVHSYVPQKRGEKPPVATIEAIKRKSSINIGTNTLLSLTDYNTGALPVSTLSDASAAIGFATQSPESDNICRRMLLLSSFDGATVMSQALAATAFLKHSETIHIEPASGWCSGALHVGRHAFAIDKTASVFMHWYRPAPGRKSPFDHHYAYNLLKAAIRQEAGLDPALPGGSSPESIFKDRIVFLGSTATGTFDNWATPLAKVTPGVEIQATALANLLRGESITRVPRAITITLVILLTLITAAATCLGRRRTIILISVPLLLLALILGSGYAALHKADLFIEIIPPILAVISTFLAMTLTNYLTERRHSRMVRGIFEHYLDSSVVENLIANPENVRLGGERRECTVMFTDVADFTTTSESLSPEQVVHFMNIYLDAMTDIIIKEGGFVDKFIGDEIVAVFGAPNPLPDHAARACRATLRMAERVEELQPAFREAGCPTAIFARTGMCTGEVVIGNMGSENRMNYTAMGNTMNLGARIQGITKMYGVRNLVNQTTAAAAGTTEFVFREVDAVRVKGKKQAERMIELMGFQARGEVFATLATAYAEALDAYRQQQWGVALNRLAPLIESGDGPAIRLAARCREYQLEPPPAGWDGVTNMLSK